MPVQQCVLQLEITIDNPFPVAVVNRDYELLEKPASLWLVNALLLDNVVEGVTAVGILHGNAQILIGEEHFLKLYDVWMQ